MIKKGDKLLCIKDYYSIYMYHEGYEYEVFNNYDDKVILLIKGIGIFDICSESLYEHFATISEIRKMKLKKISDSSI